MSIHLRQNLVSALRRQNLLAGDRCSASRDPIVYPLLHQLRSPGERKVSYALASLIQEPPARKYRKPPVLSTTIVPSAGAAVKDASDGVPEIVFVVRASVAVSRPTVVGPRLHCCPPAMS